MSDNSAKLYQLETGEMVLNVPFAGIQFKVDASGNATITTEDFSSLEPVSWDSEISSRIDSAINKAVNTPSLDMLKGIRALVIEKTEDFDA